MNRYLYLHIGLPKTGTTSAQSLFRKNADRLAASGIVYPDITGRDNGNATAAALSLKGALPDYFVRNNPAFAGTHHDFASLWAMLTSEAHPGKSLLASSEEFARIPAGVLAERARLSDYRQHVIVLIRRQDILLERSYAQVVKAGICTASFEAFVGNVLAGSAETAFYADYGRLIADLADHFGKEHISVIRYRENAHPNMVLKDVLSALRLNPNESWTFPERLNPSNALLAAEIVAEYTRQGQNSPRRRSRMFALLDRLINQDKVLSTLKQQMSSRQQSDRIMRHYHTGNEWVAREFFPEDDTTLFPDSDCPEGLWSTREKEAALADLRLRFSTEWV